MSQKPNGLYTNKELRKHFSELGNLLKLGKASVHVRSRYKILAQHMRDRAVARKHAPWQKLYDKVYADKKEINIANGMVEKKARFQAHLTAQAEVVNKFGVTTRAIQKAITLYE